MKIEINKNIAKLFRYVDGRKKVCYNYNIIVKKNRQWQNRFIQSLGIVKESYERRYGGETK